MMPKHVLVLHKASAYELYFPPTKTPHAAFSRKGLFFFRKAHQEHYCSLKIVEQILQKYRMRYTKIYRGRSIDFSKFDLIISVGGDGTFLEAARGTRNQILLGVNSNPHFSVGRLCVADIKNFESILKNILEERFKLILLQRLQLEGDSFSKSIYFLNDILICHHNPAMMCRYSLKIRGKEEEQRSSGLWVATAAGSTGAIQSAGGGSLKLEDKRFQYMPRELYHAFIELPSSNQNSLSGVGREKLNNGNYIFKGGILNSTENLQVISLMRGGVIFVDGAHVCLPFEYGSRVKIYLSSSPIKTIHQ